MNGSNHVGIGSDLRLALEGWRDGDGPLYTRLAAALSAGIEAGALLGGTRLPPERALAGELGIGRGTVVAAYRVLGEQGLVHRRQGRGTEIAGSDAAFVSSHAAELTTSLQRNVFFRKLSEASADTIDLMGTLAPPCETVRDALDRAVKDLDVGGLARDHGYHPLGYPPLRRAVAAHLTSLGLPTDERRLLVTAGAQQAISLVMAYYLRPNELLLVEDPTFPGAIDAASTARARILTVPTHEAGADIPVLASTLARNAVRAVYLMPTYHNPTGAVMPADARREVARLSEMTGTPVIEDLTLAELSLAGEPPPPIAAFARRAPVLTIGSVSKLFWSGLRVGWVRAPEATIGQLGRLKAVADLGGSLLSQAVAVDLLANAGPIKEARRQELTDRLALLERLLRDRLPSWRWLRPSGGAALWVKLPAGSATDFAHTAALHEVSVAPGPVMSAIGGFDDFIRVPFGQAEDTLGEGVARLARAWTAYTRDGLTSRHLDVVV